MTTQFKSQCESLMLARRWLKAVDFGSPISAWTQEMLIAYREAKGDVIAAQAAIAKSTGGAA